MILLAASHHIPIFLILSRNACPWRKISCLTFWLRIEIKTYGKRSEMVDHTTEQNGLVVRHKFGSLFILESQQDLKSEKKKYKQIKFLCDSRIGDDFFFLLLSFRLLFRWKRTKRLCRSAVRHDAQTKNEIENNRQIMCASGGSMCAGRLQPAHHISFHLRRISRWRCR